MSHLPFICEVGFGFRKGEEDFFMRKGEMVFGHRILVPTDPRYLEPYSMDDLKMGDIPYNLLPTDMMNVVDGYASEVYEILKKENPEILKRVDRKKVRVRFYAIMEGEQSGH